MSEIKPCPFCGPDGNPKQSAADSVSCEVCGAFAMFDDWQKRPGEEAATERAVKIIRQFAGGRKEYEAGLINRIADVVEGKG